jgi:hypothetical protein
MNKQYSTNVLFYTVEQENCNGLFANCWLIFIDWKNRSGVWWVIAIIWTVLRVVGLIGGVYTNYATGQMMQQLNTELGDLTPTVAP